MSGQSFLWRCSSCKIVAKSGENSRYETVCKWSVKIKLHTEYEHDSMQAVKLLLTILNFRVLVRVIEISCVPISSGENKKNSCWNIPILLILSNWTIATNMTARFISLRNWSMINVKITNDKKLHNNKNYQCEHYKWQEWQITNKINNETDKWLKWTMAKVTNN